ncbi:unnamed protein product [Brassica oleracea var. botrytis]
MSVTRWKVGNQVCALRRICKESCCTHWTILPVPQV